MQLQQLFLCFHTGELEKTQFHYSCFVQVSRDCHAGEPEKTHFQYSSLFCLVQADALQTLKSELKDVCTKQTGKKSILLTIKAAQKLSDASNFF